MRLLYTKHGYILERMQNGFSITSYRLTFTVTVLFFILLWFFYHRGKGEGKHFVLCIGCRKRCEENKQPEAVLGYWFC